MSDADKAFLLRTLGPRIAPGVAALDDAGRAAFLKIVEDAVGSRPPGVQKQISLFLAVLRFLIDGKAPARQDAVLRWFYSCPIPILRKGFWGVKTLVLLGYYGRPEFGASIHYQPSRDGNAKLGKAPA